MKKDRKKMPFSDWPFSIEHQIKTANMKIREGDAKGLATQGKAFSLAK